ncbi:hypothetical protein C9374_011006 [Naegleria lovaniensis]|uniref:Uncharacterized protein n=1 Tax=Naegleria lovaniensis TaxID=51637 RepID=A0AA88GEZ4_NAELO|nr:uncharacterized protein C9374_011006 [Naegleria lovaniensis]KAG2374169.1 hypothetical protein C9374_011006 [Naegleria lovaniensis]
MYERIFANIELSVMEQQMKNLIAKQKEMKLYVKEEFKKIQLRMEKEVMDAQQDGNTTTVQTIEKIVDLTNVHIKLIEDGIDKDVNMLSEEVKLLKVLKYEKDYWKELELKMVVGENEIVEIDVFNQDLESNFEKSKEEFDNFMKEIRKMIDRLAFTEITELLTSCVY